MPRRTPSLLAGLLVLGLAAGCSDEEPAADPDRIVLTPAAPGEGHTHAPGQEHAAAGPLGDGTTEVAGQYRLDATSIAGPASGTRRLGFRILGPDGPVTDFEEEQTKLLHLYVVRTDLSEFRHLHPDLDDDGTWSTRVDLGQPGSYRVIAEFTPTGSPRPVVLGTEVDVPGTREGTTVPTTDGDDGVVRVTSDGDGEVGPDGRLRLVVSDLDGNPLQLGSYLGAAAHVTGFQVDGDRFVHVHPYGAPEQTDAGTVLTFHTTFEEPGDYRFFVQVRVDGFLHSVPVTVAVRA